MQPYPNVQPYKCFVVLVFGVELTQHLLSDEQAPALLSRCVEEIERRANKADLNTVYTQTAPSEVIRTLEDQITATGGKS